MNEIELNQNIVQANKPVEIDDVISEISDNDTEEYIPVHNYQAERSKKSVTFFDTIILQTTICLIIGIGYMLTNMFAPDTAVEIYNIFNHQVNTENNTSTFSETIQTIVDFINSTPLKSND